MSVSHCELCIVKSDLCCLSPLDCQLQKKNDENNCLQKKQTKPEKSKSMLKITVALFEETTISALN